ncbi:MAG: histidine--tRNA ligase [Candidatus Nealsonbacteria bacterium]
MKRPKFQSPTGMHDILPEEQKYFQIIYNVCEDIAKFYGFGKIDTPILEEADLFSRGIGLSTDIVQKQMYSFKTKGDDILALRPECTAPVVRAYIEHGMFNLPQPLKLWHWGPCFRYESPQAGRYRQFWQFGFEILGERSPVMDVQIIQIFYNILEKIRLKKLIVEINSIGDNQCRPYYKKLLGSYFKSRAQSLCSNCKRRLRENPLRILDCKEEKCQRIKAQAPQMIDHLCDECHNHFKEVLEFLDEIELPYRLNPYLVRGLDYYTKTVFEIYYDAEEGRGQDALVGGGRYDSLVKLLRGKDTPAVGAAAGVERIIQVMKSRDIKIPKAPETKVFLAQLGDLAKRKSLKLFEDFRKAKIPISESFGRDSLKAQLNRANRLGIKYTLILGQKEALEGTIIIRDMATGKQEIVKMDKVVEKMKKRLKK